MKRLLILVLLLGVVSQPARASTPLLGCQMAMPLACCPMKDCGGCHMKSSATDLDQEAAQPSFLRVSSSQAVLQPSTTVVSSASGISQSEKESSLALSESPGHLYDLYSDYRL